MIGVVLWSEQTLNKAVIWCDDQGDLAFYSGTSGNGISDLNPGDWVEFDLTLSGSFRIASNLRVLMEQGSPGLAESLAEAGRAKLPAAAGSAMAQDARGQGTVVPFPLSAPEPPMQPAGVAGAGGAQRKQR